MVTLILSMADRKCIFSSRRFSMILIRFEISLCWSHDSKLESFCSRKAMRLLVRSLVARCATRSSSRFLSALLALVSRRLCSDSPVPAITMRFLRFVGMSYELVKSRLNGTMSFPTTCRSGTASVNEVGRRKSRSRFTHSFRSILDMIPSAPAVHGSW